MVALLLVGMAAGAALAKPGELVISTTTSTQDSGLLDYLLPLFEKASGLKTKVIAVGTGAAIEMGRRGDADVLLVHARAQEDKFVADGFAVQRYDVMYNDFYIVGPAADPAKIKGKNAAEAFKAIADAQATFVSRADKSGTNTKELEIWKKAGITPKGAWYVEAGTGMGDVLLMSSEKGAYTLTDRATYLAFKDKIKLAVLVSGESTLFNPYGILPVNPAKFPSVNAAGAKQFVEWMTSPATQKLIGQFGVDKYGQQLFIPDAKPAK